VICGKKQNLKQIDLSSVWKVFFFVFDTYMMIIDIWFILFNAGIMLVILDLVMIIESVFYTHSLVASVVSVKHSKTHVIVTSRLHVDQINRDVFSNKLYTSCGIYWCKLKHQRVLTLQVSDVAGSHIDYCNVLLADAVDRFHNALIIVRDTVTCTDLCRCNSHRYPISIS